MMISYHQQTSTTPRVCIMSRGMITPFLEIVSDNKSISPDLTSQETASRPEH